jgi:tetratricopeptide (TPR) repeat protein
MPFHTGVFGNGTIYLTPPADVPNGTRAYVYILGKDEDPVSFYRRLVMLEPEDARLYTHLGRVQTDAGRLADAEASLSRAISLDYSYADAHFNLARCYDKQGQMDSAINTYRAAAELAPDEAIKQRHYIMALVRAERFDDAFAALEVALDAAPSLLEWATTDEEVACLREDERWPVLIGG